MLPGRGSAVAQARTAQSYPSSVARDRSGDGGDAVHGSREQGRDARRNISRFSRERLRRLRGKLQRGIGVLASCPEILLLEDGVVHVLGQLAPRLGARRRRLRRRRLQRDDLRLEMKEQLQNRAAILGVVGVLAQRRERGFKLLQRPARAGVGRGRYRLGAARSAEKGEGRNEEDEAGGFQGGRL